MKQILIGKQIAYAAKVGGGTIAGINEIDLLDTGAIAVFSENNVLLTQAGVAASMADQKRIYVAVGNQVDPSSKTFGSFMIPRVGVNYVKTAYTAPVKQVKFIGNDGTTAGTALNYPTLLVNDEARIKITDTTKGLRTIAGDVKRYSAIVKSGSTPASITVDLINAINNDPDSIVVAAGVATNTGISLTAKNFGTTFDIALGGILESATIEEVGGSLPGVAVNVNTGEGTYDQIVALEDVYSAERGNTNRLMQSQLWYSNHSLATVGVTYNVYTLEWNGNRTGINSNQDTYNMHVKIAIPSSGTAPTTAFEAIMTEVFGGPFSTSKQETGV